MSLKKTKKIIVNLGVSILVHILVFFLAIYPTTIQRTRERTTHQMDEVDTYQVQYIETPSPIVEAEQKLPQTTAQLGSTRAHEASKHPSPSQPPASGPRLLSSKLGENGIPQQGSGQKRVLRPPSDASGTYNSANVRGSGRTAQNIKIDSLNRCVRKRGGQVAVTLRTGKQCTYQVNTLGRWISCHGAEAQEADIKLGRICG